MRAASLTGRRGMVLMLGADDWWARDVQGWRAAAGRQTTGNEMVAGSGAQLFKSAPRRTVGQRHRTAADPGGPVRLRKPVRQAHRCDRPQQAPRPAQARGSHKLRPGSWAAVGHARAASLQSSGGPPWPGNCCSQHTMCEHAGREGAQAVTQVVGNGRW